MKKIFLFRYIYIYIIINKYGIRFIWERRRSKAPFQRNGFSDTKRPEAGAIRLYRAEE